MLVEHLIFIIIIIIIIIIIMISIIPILLLLIIIIIIIIPIIIIITSREMNTLGSLSMQRFWATDGNRKRTFRTPGQWSLSDF